MTIWNLIGYIGRVGNDAGFFYNHSFNARGKRMKKLSLTNLFKVVWSKLPPGMLSTLNNVTNRFQFRRNMRKLKIRKSTKFAILAKIDQYRRKINKPYRIKFRTRAHKVGRIFISKAFTPPAALIEFHAKMKRRLLQPTSFHFLRY